MRRAQVERLAVAPQQAVEMLGPLVFEQLLHHRAEVDLRRLVTQLADLFLGEPRFVFTSHTGSLPLGGTPHARKIAGAPPPRYDGPPMNRSISLAHSPDSDDAFMFYALAQGKIDSRGLDVKHVLKD